MLVRQTFFMLMKLYHKILLCALLFVLFACERSNLFEPKDDAPINHPVFGPSGEIAIAVEITSTLPSFYRAFFIETNGFMRYIDALQNRWEATAALTQEEYSNVVAFFLEKDFLHLEDRYESAITAAAFRYRLTFRHGGVEKTITTDSVSAPANLQKILARCALQMAALRNTALQLSFTTDRDTLVHGQQMQLSLTVTNPHAQSVQLLSSGRLVDFFVIAASQLSSFERNHDSLLPYLWQEVNYVNATKALQSTVLASGESLVFNTQWNGRSNNGSLLEGSFWLAARCATIPGGISAWRPLHIIKR